MNGLLLTLGCLVAVPLPQTLAVQEPDGPEERYESYLAHISAANSALRLHETGEARRWLDRTPGDRSTWEWRYLNQSCDTSTRRLTTAPWLPVRLDYSSDGTLIAVAGSDGRVRVIGSDDLKVRQEITVSDKAVYSARFSPDNSQLVTCSRDGKLALWSVGDGQQVWEQASGGEGLADVAFHPGGRRIAFCSWYRGTESVLGLVSLRDASSGSEIWKTDFGVKPVVVVRFSPDGERFAVGTWDALVGLWQSENPGEPVELNFRDVARYSAIDDIAFSPDGQRIVAASKNGSPRIWNLASGQIESEMDGQTGAVFCVAFAGDGQQVITGGSDGVLGLRDAASGSLIHRFMGHENRISCLALRPGRAEVVSGSADGTLRVWTLTDQGRFEAEGRSRFSYGGTVSADGRLYATGGQSPSDVTIWDADSRQELRSLAGLTDSINFLDFGPDNLLVGGNWAGDVVVWDAEQGVEVRRLESGEQGGLQQCAFSPDGRWIAASTNRKLVAVWDARSGALVRKIPGAVSAWGIDFSPDSGLLAFGMADGSLHVLNVETWTERFILNVGQSQPNSVRFSPDGRRIACGCENGTLTIAGSDEESVLWSTTGHSQRIWSVGFLRDGSRLASGGSDQKVRLWDVSRGQAVLTLSGFDSDVYNLEFSPVTDSLFVNFTRDQRVFECPGLSDP